MINRLKTIINLYISRQHGMRMDKNAFNQKIRQKLFGQGIFKIF